MGELYRIGALVISMRYRDNERHHKPHTQSMRSLRCQSVWMANFTSVRCRKSR